MDKCKSCLCGQCRIEFGTDPATCPISECPWCDTGLGKPIKTCGGYLDKGGTYGKKPS